MQLRLSRASAPAGASASDETVIMGGGGGGGSFHFDEAPRADGYYQLKAAPGLWQVGAAAMQ